MHFHPHKPIFTNESFLDALKQPREEGATERESPHRATNTWLLLCHRETSILPPLYRSGRRLTGRCCRDTPVGLSAPEDFLAHFLYFLVVVSRRFIGGVLILFRFQV